MNALLKQIISLRNLYRFLFRKKIEFYNWYTIPSYQVKRDILLKIAKKYRNNFVFIETGTFMGDTVAYIKGHFTKVFSIELNEDLAKKATARFKTDDNVSIIQGDSAKELAKILKMVDTSCVLWLDGHYSSEFWIGDEYIVTAKGEKETPILEELKQVANHRITEHIILIDDARLFRGKNDYPHLKTLRSFVKQYFPSHSFIVKQDIIRILPLNK